MTGPRLVTVVDTDLALGDAGAKVDDGFALALALASPELDVALVTTVAGNVDLATATARTTALLERLGRPDIPVAPGGMPYGGAAARALAGWAIEEPGELTVVALGPLTTLAAALASDARVAPALREVVVMGGRFLGPAGAPAEFNARTDPWATRSVIESGVRARFVGLDVTTRIALGPDDLDRLASGGSTARYLADHARARLAVLAADGATACPMHDPLAVLAVTHPDFLTWRAAEIEVVVGGGHGGVTAVTLLADGAAALEPCRIAVAVDADAAKDLMLHRLAGMP